MYIKAITALNKIFCLKSHIFYHLILTFHLEKNVLAASGWKNRAAQTRLHLEALDIIWDVGEPVSCLCLWRAWRAGPPAHTCTVPIYGVGWGW